MLTGKKILIGITGSIAAYKTISLVRLLIKQGADVKVIMTPAAKDFVSSLTLSTLSKNPVLIELFDEQSWSNHVMLGRWADVMVIAPLSCNTLARMAHGQCDNLLLATYLSATCPVVVVPAMDEDMWHHPATKNNLKLLESYGNHVMPVATGELASGLFGEGRMAEPEEIVEYISKGFLLNRALQGKKALVTAGPIPLLGKKALVTAGPTPLQGKKALVTAGPTYEAIDPVRFIGNHSSGKMGIAVAEELAQRGAEVTLVLGPTSAKPIGNNITVIAVTSASEMFEAANAAFEHSDLAVMAAAVADFTPAQKAAQKIKKKEQTLSVELVQTKDILKSLGEKKKKDQVLVGFALETFDEKANAQSKLKSKNADLIVLNSLNDEGAGFGLDTNKITIFSKEGEEIAFDMKSKKEVAGDIVDTIIKLYYA